MNEQNEKETTTWWKVSFGLYQIPWTSPVEVVSVTDKCICIFNPYGKHFRKAKASENEYYFQDKKEAYEFAMRRLRLRKDDFHSVLEDIDKLIKEAEAELKPWN
jgi:hypothetical protein